MTVRLGTKDLNLNDDFNQPLEWSFGLRTPNKTYLTCDTFGNAVSVAGKVLRGKQRFLLEQVQGAPKGTLLVNIRTPNKTYLGQDTKRKLTADSTSKGKEQQWEMLPQEDGKFAFKGHYGTYLSCEKDNANSEGLQIDNHTSWIMHLAYHPQVCFRNIDRKQYLSIKGDQVVTTKLIPFGLFFVFFLDFFLFSRFLFAVVF
eukprot:Lithocolla_globosa_v1_NODE_298_length_4602_cov_12.663954.p2 type:complete len:201 gc:universal NODE_298_length_4602_cov_12.663954:2491-3093(+)